MSHDRLRYVRDPSGRFELGSALGTGAFATVWAARVVGDGGDHELALKIARAPSAAAAARLRWEAELMTRAGPAAPAVWGCGEADGRAWVAMERIRGSTAAESLRERRAPFTVREAARQVAAIARAVASIHANQVVHRDLAPANLFVVEPDREPSARIIDFGLAAVAGNAVTSAGTPAYMAPEALAAGEALCATDIYSLGALLVELLTLTPPFVGDAEHQAYGHLHLRPPTPSSRVPAAAPADDMVLACLQKDPVARPSASELADALGELCQRGGSWRPAATPRPLSATPESDETLACLMVVAGGGAALARMLADAGAILVTGDGDQVTCALTAAEAENPAAAAVALAKLARKAGAATVFLHTARVAIHHRPGKKTRIGGDSAMLPDSWMPDPVDSPRGLIATAAFARTLPADTQPIANIPGFFEVSPRPHRASAGATVGRDGELDVCIDAIAGTLAGDGPLLITVAAAPGLGKTRFAQDVAATCRRRFPGATVADTLPVAGSGPAIVIIDDAHRVPAADIEAVAANTLLPDSAFVAVLLGAPGFFARHPGLGQRAYRHVALTLSPLDDTATRALLEGLLTDVDYPPAVALHRIAGWAGGNPAHLEHIVRALREDGVIATTGTRSRIDTGRLGALPEAPASEWLAARALAAMPTEIAALARELSVLGPEITAAEADHVHAQVATGQAVDTAAGLAHLEAAGILVPTPGGYRLASALLREGIRRVAGEDLARAANAAALELWRRQPDSQVRIAHAARAAEAWPAAAEAALALATVAEAAHHPTDADREATACLAALERCGPERRTEARALSIRGRARIQLDRGREAIADFQAVARIARELGDPALEAAALLDEATALDWAGDLATSERRAIAAAELLGPAAADSPAVQTALGRSAWRRDDFAAAAELLDRAEALAREAGDRRSQTVALLLLPLAQVMLDQLEAATARFEQVIELCAGAGDKVHLSAAYGNRTILWSALNRPDRSRGDLRRALSLAREVGHPSPERAPTYNLAEDLYWAGDAPSEALALARRSRLLQMRFLPAPVAEDALLVARILADAGDAAGARVELAWIEQHVPGDVRTDSVRYLATMVELRLQAVVGGTFDAAAWDALCAASGELVEDERIEILWARAEAARKAGSARELEATVAAFRDAARHRAVWRRRLADFGPPG